MADHLRARDVRVLLKAKGFEQGVMFCLEALAEQQSAMKHAIVALTQQHEQMMNLIAQLASVSTVMKDNLDKIDKPKIIQDTQDDLGPVTE